MFAKQSMINRLSNPINRNRSAAKISKVMSSNVYGGSKVFLENKVIAETYSTTCVLLCRWEIRIWQSELWGLI